MAKILQGLKRLLGPTPLTFFFFFFQSKHNTGRPVMVSGIELRGRNNHKISKPNSKAEISGKHFRTLKYM
jgi:hypothetical protein